jgi:polysaccharide export outer membrane protein
MHWRLFFSALPLSGLALCSLPTAQALAQASVPWSGPESPRTVPSPAPQPIVSTTPQSVSLGQRDAYVLGAGDQIQVDVFNVPEFSGSYTVLVDGTLSIPWLGNVDVQGMTLRESTTLLTQRYAAMLTRPPQVTVTLKTPRPVRVVVAGEVRRPGSYDISFTEVSSSDGSSISWPTLTQVIQDAGGVTEQANVHRIQVIRPNRSGTATVMAVNLWELIQSGDLAQDLQLRDGDRVVVSAAARSPEEDLRIASANFSPQEPRLMRVAVAGEIRRPGTYSKEVDPGEVGPTLTEIIRESGGITEQADVRRVQIIRPTPIGEPMVLEANLWDLIQSGDLDQDIRLRDGDRVMVSAATAPPEELLRVATANFSPDNIVVQVVGEVAQSGSIELPVNASLNQAILAAGGLDNPRVQSSSVELVRLNRDGTVLKQTYDVDFSAPPNDQNNPILRSDDVIIVRRTTIARTTDWLNVLAAPFIGVSTFIRLFGF